MTDYFAGDRLFVNINYINIQDNWKFSVAIESKVLIVEEKIGPLPLIQSLSINSLQKYKKKWT